MLAINEFAAGPSKTSHPQKTEGAIEKKCAKDTTTG
jgi:hypothetical protein